MYIHTNAVDEDRQLGDLFYVHKLHPLRDDFSLWFGHTVGMKDATDKQSQAHLTDMKRIRVLIVDDNAKARSALRALLLTETAVIHTSEAANGQEAIAHCQQFAPDVILMDVQMPGLNGLEAARLIKHEHPEIRIIIMSMDARFAAATEDSGADAFISKSSPPAKMLETVTHFVK